MKEIKICSLFSGIGGIEKGVKKALEEKKYSVKVIEAYW